MGCLDRTAAIRIEFMDDEPNLLLKAAEAPQGRRSPLAITSFVAANLSLAGLLLGNVAPGLVYLFLFFVPAIVTGHLARRAFREHPGAFTNEAMAAYGLAVGYLGLVITLFVVAVLGLGTDG